MSSYIKNVDWAEYLADENTEKLYSLYDSFEQHDAAKKRHKKLRAYEGYTSSDEPAPTTEE